jgi:hypothetical protein
LRAPEKHSSLVDQAKRPVSVCGLPKRLEAGKHPAGGVIGQLDEIITENPAALDIGPMPVEAAGVDARRERSDGEASRTEGIVGAYLPLPEL